MITKSAKEKRRAERRREVAQARTRAYETNFYACEDEKFLASRSTREAPKSSLDRPLSRLPENQLVWVPYVREGSMNYRGGYYARRKDVIAANRAAGTTILTYWEK